MRGRLVVSAGLLMLASAPALASSCSQEIGTLQRRLDSVGAETVTGKEPANGATSSNSPKALDQPREGKPSDSVEKSSAGGVEEARTLLKKASDEEKAGEADKCRDTVNLAKEKAGSLP